MRFRILVLALASCTLFACSQDKGSTSRSPAPKNPADAAKDKTADDDVTKTPSLPVDATGFADTLEVKAKFKSPPAPIVTTEKGSTFIRLASTVTGAQFSADLHNATLLLSDAQSAKIMSPETKSCAIETFTFNAVGAADESILIEARDKSGNTDCQDFAKAVQSKGLQMSFTRVPIQGGSSSPIETVFVTIQ